MDSFQALWRQNDEIQFSNESENWENRTMFTEAFRLIFSTKFIWENVKFRHFSTLFVKPTFTGVTSNIICSYIMIIIQTLLASQVFLVSAFITQYLFTVTTINIPCWLSDISDGPGNLCRTYIYLLLLVFSPLLLNPPLVFTLACCSLSRLFLSISFFEISFASCSNLIFSILLM